MRWMFVWIALLVLPLAAVPYQTPRDVLARLVDQPTLPTLRVSPDRRWAALLHRPGHDSIADLSEPEYKLAGLRFNPRTFAPSRESGADGIEFKMLDSDKTVKAVGLPAGRIAETHWSPDSSRLALVIEEASGLTLWTVAPDKPKAHKLLPLKLNGVLCQPAVRWEPGGESLLVSLAPGTPAPAEETVPKGPVVQESNGEKAPVRTYQDLLKDEQDAELFDYYATSQLARVSLDGAVERLGEPRALMDFSSSPDGRYLLTQTIREPYSLIVPVSRFAGSVTLADRKGKELHRVARYPAAENLPKGFDSVREGRRRIAWRADAPATLVWAEAADGGDMSKDTEIHDRVFSWPAPFDKEPVLLAELPMRFSNLTWGNDDLALISEWRFSDRKVRTWKFSPGDPSSERVLFEERSYNDRYRDPGSPLMVPGPFDRPVMAVVDKGEAILLHGLGASPEGNIPFLDRWNISTGKAERVWRSEAPYYERVAALAGSGDERLITLRESVDEPPNYFLRDRESGALTPITDFQNPTPEFKGVSKELITYQRKDGVELSGTLYLPAGYQGGRLPVLMWAYPREFKDPEVAGQVTNSPYEFKRVSYWGPLPFLALGYAVFDNPKMPIVGAGDRLPNDTFREQLVSSAQAAVDVLVEKGVCDPNRVAIGGHSYGAFMVANLLAHSDIFKTGIARSGAYNRSLTPFGFQGEERDFWEAQGTYAGISPFFNAEKINEPILLIHGAEDDNSGTFPMQSERLFAALKGLGGRARLVMLPKEAHHYISRESLLHMLWEEQEWLKKHL